MQVLSRVWQSIRWFFRRFQVIRWLILLGLTVILIFSAWFTYKAKTADVQNIKSTLQTKTVFTMPTMKKRGHCTVKKGRMLNSVRLVRKSKTRLFQPKTGRFTRMAAFPLKEFCGRR